MAEDGEKTIEHTSKQPNSRGTLTVLYDIYHGMYSMQYALIRSIAGMNNSQVTHATCKYIFGTPVGFGRGGKGILHNLTTDNMHDAITCAKSLNVFF